MAASHGSPPQAPSATTTHRRDPLASDDSLSYHSPVDLPPPAPRSIRRPSSFSIPAASPYRRSMSTTTPTLTNLQPPDQPSHSHPTTTAPHQPPSSLYAPPSATCRYRCLDPVLPYLRDIIPASVACDLLDVYLTEPGSSLFRCASPYIITRVFRKASLLHPSHPRITTPALLATMLWCAAQTADIVLLHVPGSRARICNALYELATALISDREPDRWRRIHGMLKPACPRNRREN